MLIKRIHVKYKVTAGFQKKRDTGKCLFNILFSCQMIDAVQRAKNGIDSTVKIKRLHPLTKEKNGHSFLGGFFLGDRKHFHRTVHTVYIKPPARQRKCQAPCSASQIKSKAGSVALLFQKSAQIVGHFFVIHICGQRIIITRKHIITHSCFSSFLSRRWNTSS